MMFQDRVDAGRRLAPALERHRDEAPIVLGLTRGGVPVAYEVAQALSAPLDVWVVRKVGAPGQQELGLGAVAEGGETYLDEALIAEVGLTTEDVAEVVDRKRAEVDQRVQRFRRGRPPLELAGRTVIVVDDGIATGGTVRAALRAIRRRGPKRLILAVPVAAEPSLESLRGEADELVCLDEEPNLMAIGLYYRDFDPTSDDDVMDLLERARRGEPAAEEAPASGPRAAEQAVDIDLDDVRLEGSLVIPDGATGLVVFAHGSGSSRHSPRNRLVAGELQRAGLATLLFDLLTAEEEAGDEATGRLRFDVSFLAKRVVSVAEATRALPETRGLRLGYFGASTGAAAALIAAATRPDLVSAVVSRGGRPDLAHRYLAKVVAPTLLIVGSEDTEVLALNEEALELLGGARELVVVPGATHLFEEPGALQHVARAAGAWLVRHLASEARSSPAREKRRAARHG